MKHRFRFPLFVFLICAFFLPTCVQPGDEEAAEADAELLLEAEGPEYETEPGPVVEEAPEYERWDLPFQQENLIQLYDEVLAENHYYLDGMQLNGVNYFVYDSRMNYYLMRHTSSNEVDQNSYSEWYSLEGFEIVSGRQVTLEENKEYDFNYYNPDFIAWGVENMVPDPENSIGGMLAREIYQNCYSRFFRLNTEAYLWLEQNGYEIHQGQYVDAMQNVDFEGLNYLERRYRGELDHYTDEHTRYWGDWTPELAIGFWLRRGLDGTHDELWEGLMKVLETYDAEWLAEIQEGQASGEGEEGEGEAESTE